MAVNMLGLATKRFASVWQHVSMGPPDPILGVAEAFKRDTQLRKVNLGVGAYRDDNNKPWVLPCVRKAEELLHSQGLDHEYSPLRGIDAFRSAAVKLAYGENCAAVRENRVASVQCLSGTGSLRLGMAFLERFHKNSRVVLVPKPTWGNHKNIARDSGLSFQEYRYYDPETKAVDVSGLLADLEAAPPKSVVLLHACAHNPTGADPTQEDWKKIQIAMARKQHVAFFDMAYQGFASGDPEKDAFAVRHFVKEQSPVLLAQSFAKNFGLYGERVGNFSIVSANSHEQDRILSQLLILTRPMHSSPPLHGARLVSAVLNTPDLAAQWSQDVRTMADRIISMRAALVSHLKDKGSQHNWSHITQQIGMFAYTGLSPVQSKQLTENHHIYLTLDGRISIAGLNTRNVEYVADAMEKVTRYHEKGSI